MKITPYRDRLLVRIPNPEKREVSGLIIPVTKETYEGDNLIEAEVLGIGTTVEEGIFKVGDIVMIPPPAGHWLDPIYFVEQGYVHRIVDTDDVRGMRE